MKLLMCFSFILGCWSLVLPLQKPVGIQEHVEKLSWTESNCIPTITSAGNETMCIQDAPFDPIIDSDIPTGTTTQYCGYIQFNGPTLTTKMFFWLIMSETTDPKTSPLVLWMNGGPGVSSLLGLWDQWGPQSLDRVGNPNSVVFKNNQDRLTEKMSWIFLEQPAGVGYSTIRTGFVADSMTTALDISAFLDGILRIATFNYKGSQISLMGVPLHIGGESFAGHYLPAIGSALVTSKKATKLNLKSIFCGNGLVDVALIGPGINDVACLPNPAITLTPSATLASKCALQQTQMSICSAAIDKCRKTTTACGLARKECETTWGSSWATSFGLDPYDATRPISWDEAQDNYWETQMETFLSKDDRKGRFNVDKSITWSWFNRDMWDRFQDSGDYYRSYVPEIGKILDGGIDFMLYAVSILILIPVLCVCHHLKLTKFNSYRVIEISRFQSQLLKPLR
jgi:cathepsin A (carboxypeptidase C)